MEKRIFQLLTTSCDKKCKHCYVGSMQNQNKDVNYALKQAKLLLDEGRVVRPIGGEILINPDYLRIYSLVGKTKLGTNGHAIFENPSLLKKIKKCGINELEISLHFGMYSFLTNESISIPIHVAKLAKKKKFKVSLNNVISSKNYKSISQMVNLAHNLGAYRVNLVRLCPTGRGRNLEGLLLDDEKVQEVFKQTISCRERYDKNELEIKLFGNFGTRRGTPGEALARNNKYCPAGKNMFVITPKDKIYPCPFLLENGLELGAFEEHNEIFAGNYKDPLKNMQRNNCIAARFHKIKKT